MAFASSAIVSVIAPRKSEKGRKGWRRAENDDRVNSHRRKKFATLGEDWKKTEEFFQRLPAFQPINPFNNNDLLSLRVTPARLVFGPRYLVRHRLTGTN